MPTSSHSDIPAVLRSTDEPTALPSRTTRILVGVLVVALTISGFAVVGSSFAISDDQQAEKDDKKITPKKAEEDAAKNTAIGPDGKPIENPFPNRFPAPSLDGGEAWLNTSGEISLKDLRGKVVLIDFWTYCCINCIHVLPDLKYLEQKYPDELVVIGCHSAKFDNEKDTEAIRRAIVRYEIEHPVINDAEMVVWRKMGAKSWPTLVLIDPEGNYCGYISGEGNRELLDVIVEKLIAWHSAKGTLDRTPVRFDLERDRMKSGPLKFPGKLLADTAGDRLFVSDSNHNRIVVSTLDGKLIDVIGNGQIGATDGGYDEASFDHPQGMALDGQTLYVADTENHLLRSINLETKQVSTLAGTGMQDRRRTQGGTLKSTALNSPWDLEIVDDILFIAMAGPHQLWSHEIGTNDIGVFAGTGREDIIDGPLDESALAQPSGISSDGKFIYVADSEGSSIRQVSVDPNGKVTTIAGAHDLPNGRTLFEFGDRDGIGSEARLQHPLGVHYSDGKVFVADAYNHKIKIIDTTTREVTTWSGTGKTGTELAPLQLHEPAGMTLSGNTLYVADTNNHRIVTIDLKTKAASNFEIVGLSKPIKTVSKSVSDTPAGVQFLSVPPQKIAAGKTFNLSVDLQIPEGYKLNDLAPLRAKLVANGKQSLIAEENLGRSIKGKADGTTANFAVPLAAATGSANLQLSVTYSFCRGGVGGLCKLHTSRWTLPVAIAADGASSVKLKTDMPK
ncbi:MAG: thioredoxin-like domain-containing protein [Planctomycetales bacterium]|jgi:DNA-binding beta-propeller fold protein YncE